MNWIKKIFALLILLAFMANTFHQASLVLSYHINKAAYIKNCENKFRPELKCNGQCQLMKKMAQQRKDEQKFPDLKLENKTEVISSSSFFPSLVIYAKSGKNQFPALSDNRTVDQPAQYFHPPGC